MPPEEFEDKFQNIAVPGDVEPAIEALAFFPRRETRRFEIAHESRANDPAQLELGLEGLNIEIADGLFRGRLRRRVRARPECRLRVSLGQCVE